MRGWILGGAVLAALTLAAACGGKTIDDVASTPGAPASSSGSSSNGYGDGASGGSYGGATGINNGGGPSGYPSSGDVPDSGYAYTPSDGYGTPLTEAGAPMPGTYHSCTFNNPGSCSDSEDTAWRACVATSCESTRTACFGQDFEGGGGDGVCAAFIDCEQLCACGDMDCFGNCAELVNDTSFGGDPRTCPECLSDLTACEASCAVPVCRGPWHSCSELGACCPKLAGNAQVDCANIAKAGYADDCNATYPQLGCP